MLTISPVNLNTNYQTKKQQNTPSFGHAVLQIERAASYGAKEAFAGSKPASVGFFKGFKNFFSNAYSTYRAYGIDGLRCLKSESFKGVTDVDAMGRILSKNVKENTPDLYGKIIMTQRAKGKVHCGPAKNNIFIEFKPDPTSTKTFIPSADQAPAHYFPQFLNQEALNNSTNNIVKTVKESLETPHIVSTMY